MHCCRIFADGKVSTWCSTKGASHCSTAPFVEPLKPATLGKSYWEILPILTTIYTKIAFLPRFCWYKDKYKVLYKRSGSLLLSYSSLKQLLKKGLTERFCQYLEQVTETLLFCRISADTRLCTRCSTKGAAHCCFRKAL